MNILVVEDEHLTLTALDHSISSLGHTAILARTGEEAITRLSTNKIDFIISDIMMPGISGLSLISVLRNVHLCRMPIILISTLDNDYIRKSSAQLGATDYISKPFNIDDIAFMINKYHTHNELK